MTTQPLKRLYLYTSNRPLDVIEHWDKEGYLYLNPPYQRGDTWGPIRRRNLIRSVLLGIPIPSIVVNNRIDDDKNWKGDYRIAVIDGKQRVTTILMFLKSELSIPGEWVGMEGDVVFEDLPIAKRRGIKNYALGFCEGNLESLEDEQEVFELVNFGGVPQGEADHNVKESTNGRE